MCVSVKCMAENCVFLHCLQKERGQRNVQVCVCVCVYVLKDDQAMVIFFSFAHLRMTRTMFSTFKHEMCVRVCVSV
jgi:hypothetical protein